MSKITNDGLTWSGIWDAL